MSVFNTPHLALLEPYSREGHTAQALAARIIRINAPGRGHSFPRLVVSLYEFHPIEVGDGLRITLRSPQCPSLGFRMKVIARYAERIVLEVHSSANVKAIDHALFESWSSGQAVDLSPFQRLEENEEKTQMVCFPTIRTVPRQYMDDEAVIREAC